MPFRASAPASLMLLGEYAVLYGKQALVCALDKRIYVTLLPRTDNKIEIFSDSYHHTIYSADIQQLSIQPPFQFVLGVLTQYQDKLKQGCTIKIESEFSDQIGLGSSAAVTVASLATLLAWLDLNVPALQQVAIARSIVQRIQGMGSGADIAASVYGGLIRYQSSPLSVEKYTSLYPLTVLYSGFKTPTSVAVKQVRNRFADRPDVLQRLCNDIDACVSESIPLIVQPTCLQQLGNILLKQQALLVELEVSLPLLQHMVDSLCAQPGIFGAKISGAGLGDCVIGLGYLPDSYCYDARATHSTSSHDKDVDDSTAVSLPAEDSKIRVQRIPVNMTTQGVCCEAI